MELVVVEGPSGSGKTTAMRNLPVQHTAIIAPNQKKPTWLGATGQGWDQSISRIGTLSEIPEHIRAWVKRGKQIIALEDFSHAQNLHTLSHQFLKDGQSQGNKYTRYEQFGRLVYDILVTTLAEPEIAKAPGFIVVINHTRVDATGKHEFVSQGRMVGNQVDPVSYARVVFHSLIIPGLSLDKRHQFLVHDDGIHEAKSPLGMFTKDLYPNDLWPLLKRINEFDKGIPESEEALARTEQPPTQPAQPNP